MEAHTQEFRHRVSELHAGSTGLGGAVVQSAALIAPAAGATAGFVFVASKSGFASPFAMVIGMLFSLCLAVIIGEFARKLPAAGSFYNYLTHAFGPKVGFVTGVMLFGAYILLLPFQLSFFSTFTSEYLAGHSVNIDWQWLAVALIVFSMLLTIAGLLPSLRTGLVFLAFEIVVFGIIAIVILVNGGADGLSAKPFDPSESLEGFSGIIYGLVFAIFAFVGFESATTLGEEVHEPRRTIPRAVLVTTLVIGIFYTLLLYSGVVGFGLTPKGLEALQTDGTPFDTLARSFSGAFLGTLSIIAVITSFIALNIVTVNAAGRMIFSMGRDRMLPRWFDHVNRRGAPDRAVVVSVVVMLAVTLILGSIYEPGELAAWAAYIATLFFIAAYGLLGVGVIKYYWEQHRPEFSLWLHGIIPVAGLVGVGIVTYGNVHPTPPSPLRWFIWATLGTIAVAGLLAFYLERRNPRLLVEAGQLFASATPEEADVRGDVEPYIPEHLTGQPEQATDLEQPPGSGQRPDSG
jgi:amino acid transporter